MALSDQLYRAVGGISATIAEGYSRASDKDQARFYEYGLGSARETRDWYIKGRWVVGDAVFSHRLHLIVHVIRQLLTMIPAHRAPKVREEIAAYAVVSIDDLLSNVPMSTD